MRATIITPSDYLGPVLELCQARRGELTDMKYLSPERAEVHYKLPLAEIIFDFFDQLKSKTRGYASLDYDPIGYEIADLVRVDVLLHGEPVDAFSSVVHREKAAQYGRQMVERLRELIPRQLFDVTMQASIGSRIVARETVKAKRKDVLAKCYGGDISASASSLEQRKKGKERMRRVGRVDVPARTAFIAALRVEASERRRRSDAIERAGASTSTCRSASRGAALQASTHTPGSTPSRHRTSTRCCARPSWRRPAGRGSEIVERVPGGGTSRPRSSVADLKALLARLRQGYSGRAPDAKVRSRPTRTR